MMSEGKPSIRNIPILKQDNFRQWKYRMEGALRTKGIKLEVLAKTSTNLDSLTLSSLFKDSARVQISNTTTTTTTNTTTSNSSSSSSSASEVTDPHESKTGILASASESFSKLTEDEQKVYCNAYQMLVEHVHDSLLHLIEHLEWGDVQGAWQSILNHFKVNNNSTRIALKGALFQTKMSAKEDISTYAHRLRKLASDINQISTGPGQEKVNQDDLFALLMNGIKGHQVFKITATLIKQHSNVKFEQAVTLLRAQEQEEQIVPAQSNAAVVDPTDRGNWYTGRGGGKGCGGKTVACRFFQKGTCTYGNKCRFLHESEGKSSSSSKGSNNSNRGGKGNNNNRNSNNNSRKNNNESKSSTTTITCYYCFKNNHSYWDCNKRKKEDPDDPLNEPANREKFNLARKRFRQRAWANSAQQNGNQQQQEGMQQQQVHQMQQQFNQVPQQQQHSAFSQSGQHPFNSHCCNTTHQNHQPLPSYSAQWQIPPFNPSFDPTDHAFAITEITPPCCIKKENLHHCDGKRRQAEENSLTSSVQAHFGQSSGCPFDPSPGYEGFPPAFIDESPPGASSKNAVSSSSAVAISGISSFSSQDKAHTFIKSGNASNVDCDKISVLNESEIKNAENVLFQEELGSRSLLQSKDIDQDPITQNTDTKKFKNLITPVPVPAQWLHNSYEKSTLRNGVFLLFMFCLVPFVFIASSSRQLLSTLHVVKSRVLEVTWELLGSTNRFTHCLKCLVLFVANGAISSQDSSVGGDIVYYLAVIVLLCVCSIFTQYVLRICMHMLHNQPTLEHANHVQNSSTWLLDSGCSSHMCNNITLFSNIRTCNIEVKVANKQSVYIKKMGSVVLHTPNGSHPIELRDVYFAPTFGNNLLSVKKLTEQGYQILFTQNICSFGRVGHTILKAAAQNGLYYITL
jgi:hypothetical protein